MKDAPMFKIDERPQFTHTVTVRVPVDGGFDKQSMKVKYQLVSDKVTAEFDHRTLEGQKDFLNLAVVEISDLVDEKGQPMPFNDEVKDHIIGLPYARRALQKGYTDGIVPGLLGN